MTTKKPQLLITGANGFIGSRLCERASEDGCTTRCVVRHSGKSNSVAMGDFGVDTDWSDALKDINVVVHLAARVHVMNDSIVNPLEKFRTINTELTVNLAKQAAQLGVKRFIYLSSIKVNGEITLPGFPFTEDDSFVPTDPYALSKYEAEQGLLKIAQKTNMEVVIIRPPLVYGPGVKANFLNMMRWLYKGIPLPFGSINNKRSLVALDNLIDLIFTCITHPSAANQVFLVSDGEDLSTTQLLTCVAKALGKTPRLLPINQSLLEISLTLLGKKTLAQRLCGSLQVDITKTRKLLNWTPPTRIDEELKKTAEYFLEKHT